MGYMGYMGWDDGMMGRSVGAGQVGLVGPCCSRASISRRLVGPQCLSESILLGRRLLAIMDSEVGGQWSVGMVGEAEAGRTDGRLYKVGKSKGVMSS